MTAQTRSPTSDEAASGTLSGSAGTRYTLVDDYPDATGADVLTCGTTAAVITFGFSAFTVPVGATSISVQVNYYDGEASTGANNCGGRLKVGGSYFNASTHNPSGTTYTQRTDNWATNPKTSAAWTVDDVNGVGANALQAFGMNSTDSNPTWRFSSIQVQVTYTDPPPISGDATITDGDETSSAAGAVDVQGAAASTDDDTTASAGAVSIGGALGGADGADTMAAAGAVAAAGVSGAADLTDSDTIAGAGTVTIAGVGSAASSDTTSGAGAVAVAAASATADGADSANSTGGVAISGQAAMSQADSSSSAGGVAVAGGAAVIDTAETMRGYDQAPATSTDDGHCKWWSGERNRRVLVGARRRG